MSATSRQHQALTAARSLDRCYGSGPDRSPERRASRGPQLLPEVNLLEVTGDIVTAGTTVFPAERMANASRMKATPAISHRASAAVVAMSASASPANRYRQRQPRNQG